MNIHEEFARLILRQRWLKWAMRNKDRLDTQKMLVLSDRLKRWRPTWEWRQPEFILEVELM